MFLAELAQQSKEHTARFNLENRAVEGCEQNLYNLLKQDLGETLFYLRGLSLDELKFFFVQHKLISDPHCNAPRIGSRVTFGCQSTSWI